MKRDQQIKFRVTEDEKEKIVSIAQDRGLTLTKFLVAVALENELPSPPEKIHITKEVVKEIYITTPNYDPNLVYEVSKIGTNLNQLARRVNGGFNNSLELLSELKAIEQQLDEVLK